MNFNKFKKIPRLSREIQITEKIDGSNAQVNILSFTDIVTRTFKPYEFIDKYCLYISENNSDLNIYYPLYIFAGSRTRWLNTTKNGDNHNFAQWVKEHANELIKLGQGIHFGEWYGKKINRNYNLSENRFALFDINRWMNQSPYGYISVYRDKNFQLLPDCCEVVPLLYKGVFDTNIINESLTNLKQNGSVAVPGFMKPEGIVIYHTSSKQRFKKTIENDEQGKG